MRSLQIHKTGQYLVDGLHNRTRVIYSSPNEQANEINDDIYIYIYIYIYMDNKLYKHTIDNNII